MYIFYTQTTLLFRTAHKEFSIPHNVPKIGRK